MQHEPFEQIDRALNGDKQALEQLLADVGDMIYNLALRMLGNPSDAEDATQEIYIRIVTALATFRKESAFSTWVYRIAVNHLLNYKKSWFAKQPPLSFEFYAADIEAGCLKNSPALMDGVSQEILAQELKMSCTNVMLQCFDAESRLIYVLGVMFQVDSKLCGELLGITPEAYRQRLSRIRHRMAEFLQQYCGLSSPNACSCQNRIGYAIANHRLHPTHLEYTKLQKAAEVTLLAYTEAMEEMDTQSLIFAQLPKYHAPQAVKDFVEQIVRSGSMATIQAQA